MPHSRTTSSATNTDLEDYPEPDPPNPAAVAAERRRTRKRKIILAVSSFIFIGIVATIGFTGFFHSRSDTGGFHGESIYSGKIDAFCSVTDFPDICVSSITSCPGAKPGDENPKSLLLCSIGAAIEAVKRTNNQANTLIKISLDSRTRSAVSDCQELLLLTQSELKKAYADVNSASGDELPYKLANMLPGLSAAVSFEQACGDGFASKKDAGGQTAEMREILKNATKETRNNLAVISGFPVTVGRRKLMAKVVVGQRLVWYQEKSEPDVVVAEDGSGNFKTIGEALEAARKERTGRFVIYVKEGVYEENVRVTADMKYVSMDGDGPTRTVVTGSKAFADGISVHNTATVAVTGVAFMARNMGFKNTAGPEKAQAVAVRVESDLSIFYNCHIDGYQNTLLALAYRQFYRNCIISGTVDIISGGGAAVFQNCDIVVKKPLPDQQNVITAQARVDRHQTTGFSLLNCTVLASSDFLPAMNKIPTYLGRAVKEYSRTVIMQSTINELVTQEGWALLSAHETFEWSVYFAEFENHGPGARLERRVKWPGFQVLRDVAEATKFTAGEFVQGIWWLNKTGVQFYTGLLDNNSG